MKGQHDVYVFEIGSTTYVRPATAFGTAGDQIRVRNLTDRKVTFDFPLGLMRGRPPFEVAGKGSKSFRTQSDADGVYVYSVHFRRRGRKSKAVGESDPRIIIDA